RAVAAKAARWVLRLIQSQTQGGGRPDTGGRKAQTPACGAAGPFRQRPAGRPPSARRSAMAQRHERAAYAMGEGGQITPRTLMSRIGNRNPDEAFGARDIQFQHPQIIVLVRASAAILPELCW